MSNRKNLFARAAMAAAILGAMASSGTGIADAAGVADFYRGKNISI